MNKYNAKSLSGFDSKKEARRWNELQLMQKAGLITELRRQVKFELIPSQKYEGATVERAVYYVADFTYYQDGEYVVEDVKPTDKSGKVSKYYKTTEAYRMFVIKRKLMLYQHGIKVREV